MIIDANVYLVNLISEHVIGLVKVLRDAAREVRITGHFAQICEVRYSAAHRTFPPPSVFHNVRYPFRITIYRHADGHKLCHTHPHEGVDGIAHQQRQLDVIPNRQPQRCVCIGIASGEWQHFCFGICAE